MGSTEQIFAIGVDVGATKIATALVARSGQVLAARHTPSLVQDGPQAVLDRIANEINRLLHGDTTAMSPDGAARVQGIGIGTPGQVFSEQGVVLNAVNMGWEKVNLVDEVRSRLSADLPVWIEKDANASALGEYYYGAARGCENFVYLGVGSGLGGGLMVDGRLVTGSQSNAAEVGHLSLDPQGLPCACGLRGCAETVASGPGLVTAARSILQQAGASVEAGQGVRLKAGEPLSAAHILVAARDGDRNALAALDRVGRALGIVASACVALLNPERMIIGGGLGVAAFNYLEPVVKEELSLRTLPASHAQLVLAPSLLESPAVGAACLVWYGNRIKSDAL